MDKRLLDKLLFTHTQNEDYYASHKGSNSQRFESHKPKIINNKEVFIINTSALMNSPVYIRKDSRYISMPLHTYNSLNINYIYSGQCTYYIDNKEVTLRKGDVCIFDTGVLRTKMRTGYDDIVINIAVTDTYFKNALNFSNDQNLMASFVLNALSANTNHDNYIIFRTHNNKKIMNLFDALLIEYFEERQYSNEIVQNYLSIITIELLCLYQENQENHMVQFSNKISNNVFNIIYYIEMNCEKCSLDDLAKEFGYHKKYICHLLKTNYNKTFKEIQMEYRIAKATDILINTNMAINEIAELVGFTNHNQFYRYFKMIHNMSPNEYKKLNINSF